MGRIPASVTNIIFRFAERGDGGTSGPTRSSPPVIDLANNRLRFNFILPMRLDPYPSKFPASAGLHLRHGYRGRFSRPCAGFAALLWRGSAGAGSGVRGSRGKRGGARGDLLWRGSAGSGSVLR